MNLDWDKVGGGASFLCAIHCVLTGVAIGLLSTLGLQFIADPMTEFALLAVAVVAGILAIWTGRQKHGKWWPTSLFVAGMGAIVARHLAYPHTHAHGIVCEAHCQPPVMATILSAGGGCLLVGFHVLNSWIAHRSVCAASRV